MKYIWHPVCLAGLFSLLIVSGCGRSQEGAVAEPTSVATAAATEAATEAPTAEPTQAVATPSPPTSTPAPPADTPTPAETISTTDESAAASSTELPESTGENDGDAISAADIAMALPVGDPQNGEALNVSKACSGCHLLDAIGTGPSWKADNYAGGIGIAQRADERWQEPDYTGQATNATEYLVESILSPNDYVIEGYMTGTMPSTYHELLTDQELADIVAYLLGID